MAFPVTTNDSISFNVKGRCEIDKEFKQFKPDEITSVVKDFEEPGTLASTRFHLSGAKYMVINLGLLFVERRVE
uniref:Uncharacterized protein n=1 Tax=Chenopodium quinoa TaxID=63459 RepID=A0A803N9U9_CHEQI